MKKSFNRQIIEAGNINIFITHIRYRSLSWLGTSIPIKKWWSWTSRMAPSIPSWWNITSLYSIH